MMGYGYGYAYDANRRKGRRAGIAGETPANTELSPEATSINLTLTANKKGGKNNSASVTWESARASTAATGKVYFEAEATILSGSQEAAFGLYNATFTLSGDEPGGANSAAYQSIGRSGDEGTFTARTGFVQNERVMFAYDSGNGKFWIGRLGTWVGDPAAGTGEAGTITGTLYPGISLKTTGGEIYLYLSAADWLYSAPTGWGSLANPGEAAVGFNVLTMTGINRWYDPSDAAARTLNGSDQYTALLDKSGLSARNVTSAGEAKSILNGLDIVSLTGTRGLDGARDEGVAAFSGIDKPFTIMCVGKAATTGTTSRTVASFDYVSTTSYLQLGTNGADNSYRGFKKDNGSVTVTAKGGTLDTNAHVFEYVCSGTTLTILIDGVVVLDAGAFDVGEAALDRFVFGRLLLGSTAYQGFNGLLGEMIVCAAALDVTERGNARTYLANKWGITLP